MLNNAMKDNVRDFTYIVQTIPKTSRLNRLLQNIFDQVSRSYMSGITDGLQATVAQLQIQYTDPRGQKWLRNQRG